MVADGLAAAAEELAASFAAVTGEQWLRPGRRSDGASFTVETFARYFMHDPIHHLYDVTGVRADEFLGGPGIVERVKTGVTSRRGGTVR